MIFCCCWSHDFSLKPLRTPKNIIFVCFNGVKTAEIPQHHYHRPEMWQTRLIRLKVWQPNALIKRKCHWKCRWFIWKIQILPNTNNTNTNAYAFWQLHLSSISVTSTAHTSTHARTPTHIQWNHWCSKQLLYVDTHMLSFIWLEMSTLHEIQKQQAPHRAQWGEKSTFFLSIVHEILSRDERIDFYETNHGVYSLNVHLIRVRITQSLEWNAVDFVQRRIVFSRKEDYHEY